MEYPISEIFYSVQGEGNQSGTPMVFVRLAGCTVGKPYTTEYKQKNGLAIFQNECKIYDGRTFPCDTDYRISAKMSEQEILKQIRKEHPTCKWVSITGGEPLMHNLLPLVAHLQNNHYELHLETSGTIPIVDRDICETLRAVEYTVVSPKYPFRDEYLDYADEIRILVDDDFKWESVPESIRNSAEDGFITVYISPVNSRELINPKNADKCFTLIKDHPYLKISLQIHKILGVR